MPVTEIEPVPPCGEALGTTRIISPKEIAYFTKNHSTGEPLPSFVIAPMGDVGQTGAEPMCPMPPATQRSTLLFESTMVDGMIPVPHTVPDDQAGKDGWYVKTTGDVLLNVLLVV